MRTRIFTGSAAMVLAATSLIGVTASQASPTIRSVGSAPSGPAVPAKAPLLTVRTVASAKTLGQIQVSGTVDVSGNGVYLLLAQTYGTGIGTLYNTQTAKQIAGEIGPPEGAEHNGSDGVIGVDDNGVVYGNAEQMVNGKNVAQNFVWQNGKAGWIPNPSATEVGEFANCHTNNAPVTNVYSELYSVNPQGEAVGTVGSDCGPSWDLAMAGGANGQWSPTGKTDGGGYAAVALSIDEAGVILGTASPDQGSPEYVWSATSTAISLATLTGYPNAAAAPLNSQWWGTHFIGSGMTAAGGASVWEGSQAFDLPDQVTDNGGFFPEALGPGDEVIGQTSTTMGDTGQTVPSVWYRGGKLTPLTSLAHKTSLKLTYALAVDRRGDIFGIGQTKTADVLFEAQVPYPPPTVSIKAPKSGHSYKKGAKVKASYTCKPGKLVTLKSCKGTVKDHHRISTAKVGAHSFKVVATDKDGRKTTKTVHYKVKK